MRARVSWGVVAGLLGCLGACNALLGIDEADVRPGPGAAGQGGAPGAAGGGAAGAGGRGGAGGASGAGGGASGAGGRAGPSLDASFGDQGVATTDLGGTSAKALSVVTLQPLPSGAVAVAGHYDFFTPEAFDQGDAFVARLDAAGRLDPTFASDLGGQEGFQSGQGAVLIDRTVSSDTVLGAHVDEAQSSVVVRTYHADTSEGTSITRLWHAELRAAGSVLSPFGSGGDSDVLSTYVFPSSFGGRLYRAVTPGYFLQRLSIIDVDPTQPLPSPPPPTPQVALPDVAFPKIPIFAAAAGGFVYVVANDDTTASRVGFVRLIEWPDGLALDTQLADGTGFATVDFAPLGFAISGPPFGVALDRATRDFYVGLSAAEGGAPRPVAVKFKADGGLDESFGTLGVLDAFAEGDPAWACLAIDAAGGLVVAGVSGGQPRARRFSAQGAADPSFGPDGVALPFAPQRCALDAVGRLLLAGPAAGEGGKVSLALARLHLGGAAP
ncbi:MAG TPA: hypothetical protein VFS43_10755 [Polyangiaceae bacterium]|nr:hypothetical protein [Polyangiaceae bacterium]